MNNWKLIKFLDVLEEPVRNGIYKSKEFHGIGTKIVNMGELFSNGRLYDIDMRRIYLTDKEKDKYILKNGDLIFARRSLTADGAGKCSLIYKITEDVVFESSIIRARPNLNKVDSLFLFYFFNSPYGKYLIGTILRQVAVAGITGSDLMRLEFLLPPLLEQKAIAGVLGSLDDKIDLLQRQNTTLEAMAETLFRQWFIEEAQEDWEEYPLSSFIEIIGGGTPKTSEESYWHGDILWMSGGDIASSHKSFIFDTDKKISSEGLENSSAKLLPKFSTVITARGTVGKICLLGEQAAFSQTNYGILPRIAGTPFFTFLLMSDLLCYLKQSAYGSVFDTITRSTFEEIKFNCPTDNYIVNFENMISPFFQKMFSNCRQIRTLEKLRDTLLPKLMSGEVRVRVDG